MIDIGYSLSSEEHTPRELVRNAVAAEEAGFSFALISDHFHPWTDRQGESPFVWSVIGAVAEATSRLRLGTGVTCPMIRIHPAVIAQAAAESERQAIDTAHEWWPNAALGGDLGQELPLPRHFRQATETLTREQVAGAVVCGPDPDRHREAIREFEDAGFDHVYVHQVGPDQDGFIRFYEREILGAAV